MSKTLFISGQKEWVAEVLQEAAPAEVDVSWLPIGASDEEKIHLLEEAEFLVLHPAKLSPDLMRRA